MSKTIYLDGDDGVKLIVKDIKPASVLRDGRSPVHVVYGGAHLFTAETTTKLGDRAIRSIGDYAPNFVEFAQALSLPETASLPRLSNAVTKLESQIAAAPEKARSRDFAAWFAWTVYQRTIDKLKSEPVEDFRIDFEDGYGFRPDDEEDGHAAAAAKELAKSAFRKSATPFCGIRVKAFAPETYERATRTLDIFLDELFAAAGGRLPANFAVTLPKITSGKEVKKLCKMLSRHEKKAGLPRDAIGVEIVIETPEAIIDKKGSVPLRSFVQAAGNRSVSAHFGAFDYTSSLSIAAPFQDIRHASCDFARQIMQASLSPLGIRLSDSVTTEMPIPIHRGGDHSGGQKIENRRAVHHGWRAHFENVTRSMSNGFYQSWDLHPNQLPARYAAVYSFFIYNYEAQARRLKGFIEKATQANMTGATFDDAASARAVLNFFRRAIDCRALTPQEVETATGIDAAKIVTLSLSDLSDSEAGTK